MDPPAGEQLRRHEPASDRRRLVTVGDDAGPQTVPHVRRDRIDRALVPVERDRERLPVGEPEVLLEACLEVVGPRVAGRRRRFITVRIGHRGGGPPGCVGVGLDLGDRDGGMGEPSVGEADRVVGVLPSLVPERSRPCGRVLDVAVTIGIPRALEPRERRLHGGPERLDLLGGRAPAPQLVDEHHEQGRDVRGAVVDVAVGEGEGRSSREPDLMQVRPGCSSLSATSRMPCMRARLRAVPNPRVGSSRSAIHDVRIESRPKSVMYQGLRRRSGDPRDGRDR